MTKKLHAGVVQWDVRPGAVEENLKAALDGIRALADVGADLAVLPELWSGGFHARVAADARQTPAVLDTIARAAADLGLVVAGSLPEAGEQGVYNTLYVHDSNGALAGAYHKVHLFSPTGEDRLFLPGDRIVTCRTAAGFFGLMICFDIRFPELCRAMALDGVDGVIVSAQWPASRAHHWEALLTARAIENQVFVVGANRCGQDKNLVYAGGSRVITAVGQTVAQAGDTEAGVIHAVLDPAEQDRFRRDIPCLRQRRPAVYNS